MYDVRPWSDVYNFIKTTGRVPISLSCGHTVCQTCLQSLQRNQCPFDQVCWLVSWLVGPFIGWVVGLLVEDDWFGIIRLVWACYLFGGFIGFSYWWIDWMIYWFIYWLVDWLIDWLIVKNPIGLELSKLPVNTALLQLVGSGYIPPQYRLANIKGVMQGKLIAVVYKLCVHILKLFF